MKKGYSLLAAALVLLFFLSACSSGNKRDSTQSVPAKFSSLVDISKAKGDTDFDKMYGMMKGVSVSGSVHHGTIGKLGVVFYQLDQEMYDEAGGEIQSFSLYDKVWELELDILGYDALIWFAPDGSRAAMEYMSDEGRKEYLFK